MEGQHNVGPPLLLRGGARRGTIQAGSAQVAEAVSTDRLQSDNPGWRINSGARTLDRYANDGICVAASWWAMNTI